MLTPEQLQALVRYQSGLLRVKDVIERLNALVAEHGFDIRPLPEYPLGMSMSDAQNLAERHFKEIDAARAAAMERLPVLPERMAA